MAISKRTTTRALIGISALGLLAVVIDGVVTGLLLKNDRVLEAIEVDSQALALFMGLNV